MARVFVRLKLRLLANSLRGSPARVVGMVLGVLLALPLTAVGTFLLATLPRSHPRIALPLTVLVFLGLAFGWVWFPLTLFAADATLDPTRLALLPLRPRQLMTGLFAASCVGVAPLATMLVLAGAVVGFAPAGPGVLLVALAAAGELALCVTASRALTTALSRWLRSRKARDLAVLVVSVSTLALNLAFQALSRSLQHARPGSLRGVGGVALLLGWSPPGLAAHAMASARVGRLGVALAELAGVAAAVLALVWVWWTSLERVLTTVEPGSPPARKAIAGLWPRLLGFLPRDARTAVAVKDLRYLVRHPRLRVQALTVALFGVALVVFTDVTPALHRPEGVFGALGILWLFGQNTMNQFGLDGAAYWTNVAAGTDPRTDVEGKNLATALVALALLGALAVALAALTGGWAYVPVAVCAGVALLGSVLAVGDYVSARFPFPVPDAPTNLWAGQSAGHGCLVGLAQLVAIAVEWALLAPVAAVVVVGIVWWKPALAVACPLALAYGALVWWLGVGLASEALRGRQPELLAALSPRRAT